ncbi:MAG: hypothetical protein ABI361_03835 [Nitrososphaera sp.]|jgi:hypothetical protein
MLDQQKQYFGANRDKFVVLASWFALLLLVRLSFGVILPNGWFGTLGSVSITFAVFYGALKFTPLRKYGVRTDAVLLSWYRKRLLYLSGFACITLLVSILILTEYGYSKYSDSLIVLQINQQQFADSFALLSTDEPLKSQLRHNLQLFSPVDIMALTLASTDATLHGYYTKIISFILAENAEIMVFMFVFRARKSIFV